RWSERLLTLRISTTTEPSSVSALAVPKAGMLRIMAIKSGEREGGDGPAGRGGPQLEIGRIVRDHERIPLVHSFSGISVTSSTLPTSRDITPRPSGRSADQLRSVRIQTGATRYAEGSVLIAMGETHVLCNASV